ncbi:MAG: metal-dependent transcriptional regulator [Proteobacteria bacterium]|nr:metal-dependent transcriptional regulator [Pseudomonadota bacterium]
MSRKEQQPQLTGALEDYLETIYELVRDRKLARVRDIAKARGVKSGSVSPAMRRLADLGYVKYFEREFIDLTPAGEQAARRIYAKHQLLTRFFTEILKMSPKAALKDACSMEHNLSNEGMDHFVRFFEFLQGCPEGHKLLDRFRACSLVHDDAPDCDIKCPLKGEIRGKKSKALSRLWNVNPGEQAQVCQISGSGKVRQSLLDKGIMPDVLIEVERVITADQKLRIRLQGFELVLSREEAEALNVIVV